MTVIVCTRDRPQRVTATIRSIVAGSWQDFELLILDQSEGQDTSDTVMAAAGGDQRIHYHRVSTGGKTCALNRGLQLAQSSLLAFTDDDCLPSPDWIHSIVTAFESDVRLMLLVGAVTAGPHDATQGFVPTFDPTRRLCGLPLILNGQAPMGANMAMRAALHRQIGGFDEYLGVGAPLRSGYDVEYCYRTFRLRRRVCADPNVSVIHNGFRSWSDGSRLAQGYAIGTAAAYTKFVRLGDPVAAALLMLEIGRYSGRAIDRIVHCRRPTNVNAVLYRLVGCRRSFDYHVDRSTLTYSFAR